MYVDDVKLAGKKQHIDQMWKVLIQEADLGEPTSFLDPVYLVALNENTKLAGKSLTITKICSNPGFPRGELRNYHTRKIFVSLHGPTIWKVMPRNVWNDIVSWQTRRLNNSTKYLLHALMTIISKKKI